MDLGSGGSLSLDVTDFQPLQVFTPPPHGLFPAF